MPEFGVSDLVVVDELINLVQSLYAREMGRARRLGDLDRIGELKAGWQALVEDGQGVMDASPLRLAELKGRYVRLRRELEAAWAAGEQV